MLRTSESGCASMDISKLKHLTPASITETKPSSVRSSRGRKRKASCRPGGTSLSMLQVSHADTDSADARPTGSKRLPREKSIDDFPTPVFSVRFREPSILLSSDRLTATGCKGWSTVLLTHGTNFGCWYFEAILGGSTKTQENIVAPLPLVPGIGLHFTGWTPEVKIPSPHLRIGWGCRYSRYDMPLGCDQFGICLRDIDGTIVLGGRRIPYAKQALGDGMVVGCGLVLGPSNEQIADPRLKPELHPFLESGLLCDPLRPPIGNRNPGARVEFVINGKSCGSAAVELHSGMYHPGVSMFMGAQCRINTGPEFLYPPPLLTPEAQELTGFSIYHPASRLSRPQF